MRPNVWVALILCASAWAFTQQPQVSSTQFKSEPASSGLSATLDRFLQQNEPLWLGYEVPAVAGTRISACPSSANSSQVDDECCGEYQLEQNDDHLGTTGNGQPNSTFYVLLRLDHGGVTRVRAIAAGCRLNAGGVRFQWLTSVQQDESVALLGELAAKRQAESRVVDQALAALSMHATPKATGILAGLAAPSSERNLREKAAFWLGALRGHEGFVVLQRLVRNEQDGNFREKLAFDLFVNSDPAVVDELIGLAKSDHDADVRGQAIFWLAQKAGKKVTATLNEAIDKDPELRVKKRAVFALSQLPKDESIPQLIHLANTNQSLVIRKEAIFWLGQTRDPRALQYIEELLKR